MCELFIYKSLISDILCSPGRVSKAGFSTGGTATGLLPLPPGVGQ